MTPERKIIINGKLIEEYYWAGRMVVYVDHFLQREKTYEQVIKEQNNAQLSQTA